MITLCIRGDPISIINWEYLKTNGVQPFLNSLVKCQQTGEYIFREYGLKTVYRVIDISCGDHHALALTEDGTVYAWGRGNEGYSKRRIFSTDQFKSTRIG